MFDASKLNKAFRSLDSAMVVTALGKDDLRDPVAAGKFVRALRESSCLALQIANATKEARRDLLVEKCRELLAPCTHSPILQDFEDHVSDARIVERGYRELFRSLRESVIWKRTPAEQTWGMILRAENEFAHVRAEMSKEVKRLAAQEHPSVDPRQVKLPAEDGTTVSPDALINGIVKNAGDTLVTLSHIHQWFDKDSGAIVLPAEVRVDQAIAYQAGMFSLAASQWRSLEDAWDRSRLFKARFQLREQEFAVKQGGKRRCTVLEVEPATENERMDGISLHRLGQMFFQSQMDMEFSGAATKLRGIFPAEPIPLSPAAYLSSEERVTVEVLDGNYFVPVDDDSVLIAELAFKAWIRGYAFFAMKAHDAQGKPIFSCLRLAEDELVKDLQSCGLSSDQARRFIRLTTFGQGAADLFDAPLLKVSDGSYCLFAPAYHTATLGVIALSRISSLNRRRDLHGEPANDCVFENKGKLFERRVVNLFVQAGLPAHGFKYNVDGTDYDCDAAVLIDDTLFVFECKNRSLPMGHLPSLHYFTLALEGAREQVKRIARQFTERPEIVRAHFGANANWSRIVPVVLHALPWSFGCTDGVYTYDASALSHLLREGFTSIGTVSKIDMHHILRRHRYPLRKGKTPTADELEREMGNPNQLRLHSLGWEQIAQPIPVSENFVFVLPDWTQRAATLEEQMIALGSSPKEAAARAREMNEEFPDSVEKIRNGVRRRTDKRKIGRNDPCPCGSGDKYKKCCLKS